MFFMGLTSVWKLWRKKKLDHLKVNHLKLSESSESKSSETLLDTISRRSKSES